MAIKNSSFVFGVSVADYNYIPRVEETRLLKMNFEEGINTILISPRRWGKTSLVQHVCKVLDKENTIPVYVDIFGCKNEYDFYNTLVEAILKQTANKTQLWMENAKEFLARLTPQISISPEPMSDIKISLGITPKTHSPEEILQLAENIAIKKDKRLVICIDEFQQIGEMPDSLAIQKKLRSVWQHQKCVSYCLFGSKKHMMSEIFQNKKMPLYQFGDMHFLEKIPTEEWKKYIVGHFNDRKRVISDEFAQQIVAEVNGYSSYVQQLAWHVFSLLDEGETVTKDHINNAMRNLLNSCELLFMQQTESLTEYQMNFLRAIASGVHANFGEQKIREKYNLGSASNITRLRAALIRTELIESDGRKINIVDPIFEKWFGMRFL